MEEIFNINDKVVYGWIVGSHVGWDSTVYLYKGTNEFGSYILENPETGGVFLAKVITHV